MSNKTLSDRNKCDIIKTIVTLSDATGNITMLRGLRQEGEKIARELVDQDTGNHLIYYKNIGTTRSEAIRIYVARLTKQYINSSGGSLAGWSKYSLTKENTITMSTIGQITNATINVHDDLFKLVVTHLFGFDAILVEAATSPINALPVKLADYLVGYLNYNVVEIGEEDDDVTVIPGSETYGELKHYISKLLQEGNFSNELCLKLINIVNSKEYTLSINVIDELVAAVQDLEETI